mmetsp:Transcript_29445/g.101551  ORF Transcript_29445/g.101551 Transcript_29445/m.101551 type:complete len:82 (-) Transcript_29445:28-273(-)
MRSALLLVVLCGLPDLASGFEFREQVFSPQFVEKKGAVRTEVIATALRALNDKKGDVVNYAGLVHTSRRTLRLWAELKLKK